MQLHPMIELSGNHEVRQAKGFKDAAAALTGEELAGMYETELANAKLESLIGLAAFVHMSAPVAGRRFLDQLAGLPKDPEREETEPDPI